MAVPAKVRPVPRSRMARAVMWAPRRSRAAVQPSAGFSTWAGVGEGGGDDACNA